MKNPQFIFSLDDPDLDDDKMLTPVIVSLAQKVEERKTEHAIGFKIYKVKPYFLESFQTYKNIYII